MQKCNIEHKGLLQGMDHFCATVNLEVQWASEATISAVERNGGVITTAYFDPISLETAVNPIAFFKRGLIFLPLIYLWCLFLLRIMPLKALTQYFWCICQCLYSFLLIFPGFPSVGKAIPRRMLPPQNLIEYYTDPKNRGYLADPQLVAEERFKLAQVSTFF